MYTVKKTTLTDHFSYRKYNIAFSATLKSLRVVEGGWALYYAQ